MTIETAANAVVELVSNAFPFEIDKRQLFAIIEDEDAGTLEHLPSDHYGLYRSDNNSCVGSAFSKQYVPHTTEDVIAVVEAASAAFDNLVRLKFHFHNAHYVHIAPSWHHRKLVFGTADAVYPVFWVRGGLDGRGFVAVLGFARDMCSNMAMMHTVASTKVSIHHNNNLRSHMDELINTFSELKTNWDDLSTAIDEMESRNFEIDHFLEMVYPTPVPEDGKPLTQHKINNHRRCISTIKSRLHSELIQRGQNHLVRINDQNEIAGVASGWLLFNAVQGYVQHDGRGAGSRTEMQGMIRAQRSPKVRLAESIALGE